jgi:hypothetical protein
MNIILWILQILLALHTAVGALWKFSNSAEQTMPSLASIPYEAWLGLAGFELVCAFGLVFPALKRGLGVLIPFAAIGIAAEMGFFCVLHLQSGDESHGPMFYWLVVAFISLSIAYGRFLKRPL